MTFQKMGSGTPGSAPAVGTTSAPGRDRSAKEARDHRVVFGFDGRAAAYEQGSDAEQLFIIA